MSLRGSLPYVFRVNRVTDRFRQFDVGGKTGTFFFRLALSVLPYYLLFQSDHRKLARQKKNQEKEAVNSAQPLVDDLKTRLSGPQ
jgi:hypothetical protein